MVLGTIGGVTGLLSAGIAVHQWWKVNKKLAMLTDASKAAELVPAWYTERMMCDDWLFGLLTDDGRTIAVRRITAVSDDGKWMDVEMATHDELGSIKNGSASIVNAVADDRRSASVQVAAIVAAIELQAS